MNSYYMAKEAGCRIQVRVRRRHVPAQRSHHVGTVINRVSLTAQESQSLSVTRSNTSSALDQPDDLERRRKEELTYK